MNINEVLSQLDEDQKKAVTAPINVPVCVRANAGSGKTRVLTSRIAYLVNQNVPGIMLLTFTNKAAKEMLKRTNELIGGQEIQTQIISGTFHHISCIFLRKYGKAIGIDNFTILDQNDAESALDRAIKEVLTSIPKNEIPNDFLTAKKLLSKYSFYRNKISHLSLSFDDFLKDCDFLPRVRELLLKSIQKYEDYKKDSDMLDFDDLIIYFRKLVKSSSKVRECIHKRYPYILSDEYQDVNFIQKDIIDILDSSSNCQFVVGDEKQSIYSWRGSNVNYILDFAKNHKNALLYILRYNYRSGSGIVKLAENAVNANITKEEDKKIMIAFQKSQVKPIIKGYFDEYEQADDIANSIIQNNYEPKETAILVRTNFLMRDIEIALRKRRIKYKIVGGRPFYEKAHIKDLLSFMYFEINPKNNIAFKRIITLCKGVGPKTAEKIFNEFKKLKFDYSLVEKIKMPKKSKGDIIKIFNVLHSCKDISNPAKKLNFVYNNFYIDFLHISCISDESEFDKKESDIEKIIESARSYSNAENFVEDLLLDNEKEDEKKDAVTISTIHRSKGLEWTNVYLPYMNKSVFPSEKSKGIRDSLDEELRLFYVAITRSRKNLQLSFTDAFNDIPEENILISGSEFLNLLNKDLYVLR